MAFYFIRKSNNTLRIAWIQVIKATFRSEKVRYENRLEMVYDS